MSIRNEWEDAEQTILRQVYDGEWTWEELVAFNEAFEALLDGASHTIDMIVDYRNSEWVPSGFSTQLAKLAKSPSLSHPNAGLIVVLGGNNIHNTLLDIFTTFFRRYSTKFARAETLAAALDLIAARRQEAV